MSFSPERNRTNQDWCTDSTTVTSNGLDLGDQAYEVKVTVAFIVSLLIIVLNAINLIILWKVTCINLRVKSLMTSMSVSDLILGVFVCQPGVIAAILEDWPFTSAFCQFTGFINGMSIGVSAWSMTAICVERYLVVARPFYFLQHRGLWGLWVVIGFIWGFNTLFFLLPVFTEPDLSYYTYQREHFICGFVWNPYWLLYVSLSLYQIIPGIVTTVCSHYIVSTLRNNRVGDSGSVVVIRPDAPPPAELSDFPPHSASESSRAETSTTHTEVKSSGNSSIKLAKLRREAKVSKVLFMTELAFFACTMPYLISSLVGEYDAINISQWHSFLVLWVLNCNSFVNIFIYFASYEEFRLKFKMIFIPPCIQRLLDKH